MSVLQKVLIRIVQKNSEGYSEDLKKKKANIIHTKVLLSYHLKRISGKQF